MFKKIASLMVALVMMLSVMMVGMVSVGALPKIDDDDGPIQKNLSL